jgi:hypothetical protein
LVNSEVYLSIYDLMGRKISIIISKTLPVGSYEAEWDGSSFNLGVYFYRLKTGTGFIQTEKLILLK